MSLTRRDALARLAGLIAMSAVPPRTLAASACLERDFAYRGSGTSSRTAKC